MVYVASLKALHICLKVGNMVRTFNLTLVNPDNMPINQYTSCFSLNRLQLLKQPITYHIHTEDGYSLRGLLKGLQVSGHQLGNNKLVCLRLQ